MQTVDIKVGSSFLLDGKCLTVDHMGDSKIFLSGQEGLIQWTHQQFQQLVELGEITNLQTGALKSSCCSRKAIASSRCLFS
ncbi:MAG: hypothetical protein QNJ18_23660 [Xenococcaceae cyanobacterium MO_167.B52]|nr:hypothetical protein [Xenococcaceae cyanobacterium MO_167.B52]